MILLVKDLFISSDTIKEDRKQLVGLLTEDPNVVLEEGAQIVSELNQSPVRCLDM